LAKVPMALIRFDPVTYAIKGMVRSHDGLQSYIRFKDNIPVSEQGSGWYDPGSAMRWSAPQAEANLCRPATAPDFQVLAFLRAESRRHGDKKRDEKPRLPQHLNRDNCVERRLRHISQEIEEQIDCLACANCCRVATVKLSERDVDKLARFLRISRAQFLRDFTV